MIEIHHLRKEYDDNVALENLHLEIPQGEVYGLIGPNGAGKTTLIRILATLMEPTYGSVRIAGIDILEEPLKVHPLIGYMSDFFSLYEDMLVWEYLDHFARCYGLPARDRQRTIDEVLELVSLEVRRDDEVKVLSRGMRQRLGFAKTLLHAPQVLPLDQPASRRGLLRGIVRQPGRPLHADLPPPNLLSAAAMPSLDFWNNPLVIKAMRVRYRRGRLLTMSCGYFLVLACAGMFAAHQYGRPVDA